MDEISGAELAQVNSFPALVSLLRDKLDWPIGDEYGFDDIVYEYDADDLGLKPDEIAKIREIHQLRPLVTDQPWGIFFISFEEKVISVTVLRRLLRALVIKKRAGAQTPNRQVWRLNDLIFVANFGRSGEREIAFAHFSDAGGDLPVLNVLGWNAKDTALHNAYVARALGEHLYWPDDTAHLAAWREQWTEAFELRIGEVAQTSQELAKQLATLASSIRARANELLAAETDTGSMRRLLTAFRKNLIHDLDEDGFADMFAQTIAYGLLAAKVSRPGNPLIADNLADMVPKTNPFLKELFGSFLSLGGRDERRGMDFDELGVRDVVNLLNRANMGAVLRDFGNRNPRKDPVIHFYEDFLNAYDKQQKVDAGIFYTPPAVVGFIVRGIDEVLQTKFGLPLGLADTTTWGELAAENDTIKLPKHAKASDPFVQILDPATGTGTFIVEIIDLIFNRMKDHWQRGGRSDREISSLWNDYVPRYLLPRITAFELKMAPYAIAHMKVGLKLSETGYNFASDARLHILLTNALQPARELDLEERMRLEALAHEAQRSNEAKEKTPFTVIVGNPPYSASTTENPIINSLVEDWKQGLNEKKLDLQREEWKFLRLAAHYISASGEGIVAFVINRDYLDGIAKRKMRELLAKQFPYQLHVDLNGDVKGEISDQNIFDIQQGVAVLILSTLGSSIRITSRIGTRDEKLTWLAARGSLGEADEITPRPPHFKFAKSRDAGGLIEMEYAAFASLPAIFPVYSSGIQTKRDGLTIAWTMEDIWRRVQRIVALSDDAIRSEYEVGDDGRDWSVAGAKADLQRSGPDRTHCVQIQYRPMDFRWTYWTGRTKGFLAYPRREVMQNMLPKHSVGLMFNRQIVGAPTHFFVSSTMTNHGTFYLGNKGQDYLAPLWIADADDVPASPNLDQRWAAGVARALGSIYDPSPTLGVDQGADRVTATHLFDWIYAILHAPSYRSRYGELLKSDFPRVPTPRSPELFHALVPLGHRLVALHLLRAVDAPILAEPFVRLAGRGETRVEQGFPRYENGKVMINESRWFEDVPFDTWSFHVGGYQVCEKWLKDRAGKGGRTPSSGCVLTEDDVLHYRRVVVALTETRRLMDEIDATIEAYGGWPGAFTVGNESTASASVQ